MSRNRKGNGENDMKKIYELPTMVVIQVTKEDVITTSSSKLNDEGSIDDVNGSLQWSDWF